MPQLDTATATYLFDQYSTWFGPPALVLHGETLDGRIRLASLSSRYKASPRHIIPPLTVHANSAGEAAKFLCLAGHYDRARLYIPAALTTATDIAAYCHCDVSTVAPITTHRQPPSRSRYKNTVRRRDTMFTLVSLLRNAEQSTGLVDAADLRKALTPWL